MKRILTALALALPAGALTAFPVGPAVHLATINAPAAWPVSTGKGVRVAVIDTGVKGAAEEEVFTGEDEPFPGDHGTAVGEIAKGVAPGATIVSVKVGIDAGVRTLMRPHWVRDGIKWAGENADVVNLSFARSLTDQDVVDSIRASTVRGTIFVVAAGNEGPAEETTQFPARFPELIAVAGLNQDSTVAVFSSRGATVFVSAPGVGVYASGHDNTGTSFAAPMVSGVAALWVAANPDVKRADRPAKFRAKLAATCKDLGKPGRDVDTGHGLVDAGKVVR